jgi:hypothetical protein
MQDQWWPLFYIFLLNPKNYLMTSMFPNKIANLNIKEAMIVLIFASELLKLY